MSWVVPVWVWMWTGRMFITCRVGRNRVPTVARMSTGVVAGYTWLVATSGHTPWF